MRLSAPGNFNTQHACLSDPDPVLPPSLAASSCYLHSGHTKDHCQYGQQGGCVEAAPKPHRLYHAHKGNHQQLGNLQSVGQQACRHAVTTHANVQLQLQLPRREQQACMPLGGNAAANQPGCIGCLPAPTQSVAWSVGMAQCQPRIPAAGAAHMPEGQKSRRASFEAHRPGVAAALGQLQMCQCKLKYAVTALTLHPYLIESHWVDQQREVEAGYTHNSDT